MYGELKGDNESVTARRAISAGAVTRRRDDVVVDDKVLTAQRSPHVTAQMCDVAHGILTRRCLIGIV